MVDAPLTPIGEDQTKTLAVKISKALAEGMPAPTKVLTSIAWRTCQTAVEVWGQAEPKNGIHAIQVSLLEYCPELRLRMNISDPD